MKRLKIKTEPIIEYVNTPEAKARHENMWRIILEPFYNYKGLTEGWARSYMSGRIVVFLKPVTKIKKLLRPK